jgi:elongation factor Ts
LLEQKFVLEQKKAVGAVAKERGVRIVGFERFVRGEGIEKKQEDFAEEVAKQIKK